MPRPTKLPARLTETRRHRLMTLRVFTTSALLFVLFGSLHAGSPAENLLREPNDWFRTDAGQETLENVLSWQTNHGDWPKNIDTTSTRFSGDGKKPAGTFDNSATSGELRLLARAYRVTDDQRYKQAFIRGFDHILSAQYANGGWPQYFPLSDGYHRHITLNDGTMIRLMEFLRDAATGKDFEFLDQDRRSAALEAVDRGIECILGCQVESEWCSNGLVCSASCGISSSGTSPQLRTSFAQRCRERRDFDVSDELGKPEFRSRQRGESWRGMV